MLRDLAYDLEAEAIPSLLAEAQTKVIRNAYLVTLTAPATVAVLFLDANSERAATTASYTAIDPEAVRPDLP